MAQNITTAQFVDAVKMTIVGTFVGNAFGSLSDGIGDIVHEMLLQSRKGKDEGLLFDTVEVLARAVIGTASYIVMDRMLRAMQGNRTDVSDNMSATFSFYEAHVHWKNKTIAVSKQLRELMQLPPMHVPIGSKGPVVRKQSPCGMPGGCGSK